MMINLTNHPYSEWDDRQKAAALVYGECVDMPFPSISPDADEDDIAFMAKEFAERIVRCGDRAGLVVHVMGEFTFCFALVNRLQQAGICCIASCAERDAVTSDDGVKQVRFHFVRFREYRNM